MKSLASGIVDCEIAIEFYLLDTEDTMYVFIVSSVVPWEHCGNKIHVAGWEYS